jgi:uncharacterized membrane protein (GlpM family)
MTPSHKKSESSRSRFPDHSTRHGNSNKVTSDENPLAAIDLAQFRQTRWRDLLIRFIFGATISVGAGIVGLTLGAKVGGLLLAFPAILPATLTLIAKEGGEQHTFHDLQGTVAGALGLVGFGIVATITIGRLNVLVALALALVTWSVVAGSLDLLWATWLRRRGVQL